MRSSILDLVNCPACHGRLKVEVAEALGLEILSGQMVCNDCGHPYPIERRMPLLYVNDNRWLPKAREAQGWVAYHQNLGIYNQPADAVDLKIPYYPEEPWIGVARHFDIALDLMKLTGREVILDLGAGRGWAAKQFALKGCRVVAIDVVADEQIGLGRAWALMENAGTRFEAVIGDSENLPFFPETFDVVFCAAVLHHTSDLRGLLKSVYEVLRPGGMLIAVNEPCISIYSDQEAILRRDAAEELSFGINESRPNYLDYLNALAGAGFVDVRICPVEAFAMNDADLEAWARHMEAISPRLSLLPMGQFPRNFLKFLRWHIHKMRQWSLHLPRSSTRRDAILQSILINKETGVVITGRK
jgi:SAM-dependent methyltransferase